MNRKPYHVGRHGLPHRPPAPRPEPRVDLAKVKALADRVIGRSDASLGDLSDELDSLSIAEGKALDVFAFKCVGCEHWFAASERITVRDEWRCDQCAGDVKA